MPTAAVVYRSRTGTTRRYAEAIGDHLTGRGIETVVVSVGECDASSLATVDHLLLGCWTNGWFVIRQHPDEPWLALARDLPRLDHAKVGLFATYTLATGSMFARMRAAIAGRVREPELELRSRDGRLSDSDRAALDRFVGRA
jgi:flavodoxin